MAWLVGSWNGREKGFDKISTFTPSLGKGRKKGVTTKRGKEEEKGETAAIGHMFESPRTEGKIQFPTYEEDRGEK